MAEKTVLVSGVTVYKREKGGDPFWFVVKDNEEDGWELPKTIARRGESSVRAAIRMMAEQGGMRAKILEEVGRSGGAAKVNGKTVTQRYLYYLMVRKEGGEVLQFGEYEWLSYPKAVKKLTAKRDQTMLSQARDILKELDRERERRKREKAKLAAKAQVS